MNWDRYIEYLQSDHWKDVRRRAIERANFHCIICGNTQDLEVHHNSYDRLGGEHVDDLAVLCTKCHELYHTHLSFGSVKVYSMADAAGEYQEYVDAIQSRKVKLGIPEIDHSIRGLIAGDVCVIVARSGVDKSALAQSLMHSIWERQRIRSIFFSMEMSVSAVFERSASMITGLQEREIEEKFSKEDASLLIEQVSACDGIMYVDQAGLTLEEIRATTQHQSDIGMIVIDYMGLVKTAASGERAYERLSEIARELKTLAKRTKTVVLCISQTNRSAGDGTVQVSMEMARDSGVIEEGADVILGMHRDPVRSGIIPVYVLKGRRGRSGVETEMSFLGDTPRIVPVALHVSEEESQRAQMQYDDEVPF